MNEANISVASSSKAIADNKIPNQFKTINVIKEQNLNYFQDDEEYVDYNQEPCLVQEEQSEKNDFVTFELADKSKAPFSKTNSTKKEFTFDKFSAEQMLKSIEEANRKTLELIQSQKSVELSNDQ